MSQLEDLHTWEVVVSGRVQGVYYRAFTQFTANNLGVTGWVRNEYDGGVRAVIQHPQREKLVEMLAKLKQGPPSARVEQIDAQPVKGSDRFSYFEIRR